MKRYTQFFAVLAAVLITMAIAGCEQKPKGASSSGAINMQDGLWEITSTVEMPGMPAGAMKPHTVTTCLSRNDAIPKNIAQTDCTIKDMKTDGNTVSWTVVCKEATSKGSITYAGTTYDGMTETTMKQDGKDMTIKTTMKGKHIGPCTK
jgi:hypothetical protein